MQDSTQMYVEAEAKMDTYEAQDGTNRTSLNLLQRKSPRSPALSRVLAMCRCLTACVGNFEALSRPQNRDTSASSTGPESNANAAEEPLSGIGQS